MSLHLQPTARLSVCLITDSLSHSSIGFLQPNSQTANRPTARRWHNQLQLAHSRCLDGYCARRVSSLLLSSLLLSPPQPSAAGIAPVRGLRGTHSRLSQSNPIQSNPPLFSSPLSRSPLSSLPSLSTSASHRFHPRRGFLTPSAPSLGRLCCSLLFSALASGRESHTNCQRAYTLFIRTG